MPTNKLPEPDQTHKALDRLLVRLTCLEEIVETTYIIDVFARLWVAFSPIIPVLWAVFYIALRFGNALLGTDRWGEMRKAQR